MATQTQIKDTRKFAVQCAVEMATAREGARSGTHIAILLNTADKIVKFIETGEFEAYQVKGKE